MRGRMERRRGRRRGGRRRCCTSCEGSATRRGRTSSVGDPLATIMASWTSIPPARGIGRDRGPSRGREPARRTHSAQSACNRRHPRESATPAARSGPVRRRSGSRRGRSDRRGSATGSSPAAAIEPRGDRRAGRDAVGAGEGQVRPERSVSAVQPARLRAPSTATARPQLVPRPHRRPSQRARGSLGRRERPGAGRCRRRTARSSRASVEDRLRVGRTRSVGRRTEEAEREVQPVEADPAHVTAAARHPERADRRRRGRPPGPWLRPRSGPRQGATGDDLAADRGRPGPAVTAASRRHRRRRRAGAPAPRSRGRCAGPRARGRARASRSISTVLSSSAL